MSRPANLSPTYAYHQSGRGRILWHGTSRLLPGEYNSPESLAAFAQMVAIVAATGHLPDVRVEQVTMNDLRNKFRKYAEQSYRTKEPRNYDYALAAACKMFGNLAVSEFTPAHLKTVRQSMLNAHLCRTTVNRRVRQIVFVFRWAVEEQIVKPEIWQALAAVRPIQRGRDNAIDYEPIQPVSESDFLRVVEAVPPRYRPALWVQLLTGMRSGELLAMRPQDVQMGGRHWYYTPKEHKTAKEIGAKIIGIPEPAIVFLVEAMPKEFSFRWFPWSVDVHRRAVQRVCEKLGITVWHPHQLRHALATKAKASLGDSAAQALLAHTNPKTTKRYAHQSIDEITRILDQLWPVEEAPK